MPSHPDVRACIARKDQGRFQPLEVIAVRSLKREPWSQVREEEDTKPVKTVADPTTHGVVRATIRSRRSVRIPLIQVHVKAVTHTVTRATELKKKTTRVK